MCFNYLVIPQFETTSGQKLFKTCPQAWYNRQANKINVLWGVNDFVVFFHLAPGLQKTAPTHAQGRSKTTI